MLLDNTFLESRNNEKLCDFYTAVSPAPNTASNTKKSFDKNLMKKLVNELCCTGRTFPGPSDYMS